MCVHTRTSLGLLLRCARHLVHRATINCVNPRTRSATLGAHAQFALRAIQHVLILVHDHVRTQRQTTQFSIAHVFDRGRVGDACGDAQRAIRALPRRKAVADLGIVIVLVQQWLARNVRSLNFGSREVGRTCALPIGRRRRVGRPANVDVFGHSKHRSSFKLAHTHAHAYTLYNVQSDSNLAQD